MNTLQEETTTYTRYDIGKDFVTNFFSYTKINTEYEGNDNFRNDITSSVMSHANSADKLTLKF